MKKIIILVLVTLCQLLISNAQVILQVNCDGDNKPYERDSFGDIIVDKPHLLKDNTIRITKRKIDYKDSLLYTVYIKKDNELIPRSFFIKTYTRYFTFIAAGQDVTSAAVNNFSLDLLDAKFDLIGSSYIFNKKLLLNLALSGDKEGNTAILFKDKKTGGKFDGEIKLSFPFGRKFIYTPSEKKRVWNEINAIDKLHYSEYLKAYCCPEDSVVDTRLNKISSKYLDGLSIDQRALKMRSIIDSAEAKKARVFNNANWTSFRMFWVTGKFKVGLDKVYSINNNFNYETDTVKNNYLATGYAGIELNYYKRSNYNNATVYANGGLGIERGNNIADFDKTTVTESASLKDTSILDPSSQKRDFTDKYEAYKGNIQSMDYLMAYANVYTLLGKNQIFGFHLGAEGRLNISSSVNKARVGVTAGIIANVPKKGDSKSLVAVEVFVKMSQVNDRINFNNDRNSMVGITFNVPISSVPLNGK